MKTAILVCAFMGIVTLSGAELQCGHKLADVPLDWVDMVDPCISHMRNQIQEEFSAAMQYMAMGAHFSKDIVNRPGFAKLFFEAASEERQHGIKLISYLLMRGGLTQNVTNLLDMKINPKVLDWESGVLALKDALKLEAKVTRKIREVIAACEDGDKDSKPVFNDYHLVDYLTGEFLEEQYRGQRDLAGKVSTLDKMMDKHGALGEWLYDKKLLSGEA